MDLVAQSSLQWRLSDEKLLEKHEIHRTEYLNVVILNAEFCDRSGTPFALCWCITEHHVSVIDDLYAAQVSSLLVHFEALADSTTNMSELNSQGSADLFNLFMDAWYAQLSVDCLDHDKYLRPRQSATMSLLSDDFLDIFEIEFINRMISAHLQNRGNTLVLGSNKFLVEIVLNTLSIFGSMFNSQDQFENTRTGLCGQVIQSNDYEYPVHRLVHNSKSATAIIDLNKTKVYAFSSALRDYQRWHYRYWTRVAKRQLAKPRQTDNNTVLPDLKMNPWSTYSLLVNELLELLYCIPMSMRLTIVKEWQDRLYSRFRMLVLLVDSTPISVHDVKSSDALMTTYGSQSNWDTIEALPPALHASVATKDISQRNVSHLMHVFKHANEPDRKNKFQANLLPFLLPSDSFGFFRKNCEIKVSPKLIPVKNYDLYPDILLCFAAGNGHLTSAVCSKFYNLINEF